MANKEFFSRKLVEQVGRDMSRSGRTLVSTSNHIVVSGSSVGRPVSASTKTTVEIRNAFKSASIKLKG